MLSIPLQLRVFLCTQATDMRKSFDGLDALVRHVLQHDPLSGDLFVFLNRRHDRVRVLYWEGDGFVIWYYERGRRITQAEHHLAALQRRSRTRPRDVERDFDALGPAAREFHLQRCRRPLKTTVHLRRLLKLVYLYGRQDVPPYSGVLSPFASRKGVLSRSERRHCLSRVPNREPLPLFLEFITVRRGPADIRAAEAR